MDLLGTVASAIAVGQFVVLLILAVRKKRKIRIYVNSAGSDGDFKKDLRIGKEASFYGISMPVLPELLGKVDDQTARTQLRKIRVYYSSLQDGELWRGARFQTEVLSSLKRLSMHVSDPIVRSSRKRPLVVEVYRQRHHVTSTGCKIDEMSSDTYLYALRRQIDLRTCPPAN